MSNPNNTTEPYFERIFIKNKKMFLALPVIAVALIVTLYFTTKPSDKADSKAVNNVDVSLPSSETKELSDSKIDVMSDFDNLSAAKIEQESKGENFTGDLSTPNNNSQPNYQDPNDDEVVKKVNKMIGEINKEKPKSTNYKNNTKSSDVSYSNRQESAYTDNNSSSTKDNFDDFFASGSGRSNESKSNIQQSETYIYAVIKGDHLGLRNNQRVSLILPKETTINGKVFKKNTVIYAQSNFNGSRVHLNINNINQFPINLKAYDAEDGGLGLQVRESLMAETSNQVAADGTDELDMNGIPLGNTIKKLLKRKQQEAKIDLLNNQKLILKK